MLQQLYIENFAIIEQTSILFSGGLAVFTGETGAGKSIVIDAIHAVCGARVSRDWVRTGAKKATVIAEFSDIPDAVNSRLEELGFSPEDTLLIQREISADGKSSARLNGKPATAQMLSSVTELLIHIHGQHDSGILLSADRHIVLLDRFAEISAELADYQSCYNELKQTNRAAAKLRALEQEKAQKQELVQFQAQEIAEARLQVGEEEQLEEQAKRLESAVELSDAYGSAHALLAGGEETLGAADALQAAAHALDKIADLDAEAAKTAEQMREYAAALSELSNTCSQNAEEYGNVTGDLNEISSRLDEIYRLKQKYGGSVEEVIAYGEKVSQQLTDLNSAQQQLAELAVRQKELAAACRQKADVLSQKRREAAERFTARVTEELAFLQMPQVKLQVQFTQCKYGALGCDTVEFLFSANPGEPPKPLAKIGSGGELSRIMLALTNALAEKEDIPTLIFDEIDTGVSGKAAQCIGRKLREVAVHRQVLCVTHSAQIAALANTQYLIQKSVENGRTSTCVTPLSGEERVEEVARIISTDAITDLMRAAARQMIQDGEKL